MKPTQVTAQRVIRTTANQKNRIFSRRILDGLKEKGISIREDEDTPGMLRCTMPADHQAFALPLVQHYKHEILAELRGEPAYTADTRERYMALAQVKCKDCDHHLEGGEQEDGRYRSGRCGIRDMAIAQPARNIRCTWFNTLVT